MLEVIDAIVKGMDINVLDHMKQASFDYAIVRALRVLVKGYLQSHKEDINDGLPFKYLVEAGGKSWDETLARTDQMGIEGELFTSLCTSGIFAVSIKMYQLQTGGNKSAPLVTHNFINGAQVHQDQDAQQAADVYISFRPGHYDGLLPGEGEYTPGKADLEKQRKQNEQKANAVRGQQLTKGLSYDEKIQLVKQFAKGSGGWGGMDVDIKTLKAAVEHPRSKTIALIHGRYMNIMFGD